MEQSIVDFTDYLRNEKKSSENTVLSYARDLKGFCRFMKESGVLDPAKVNRTNVMAYVYELQKQQKAGTTVSRNIASIRSFFQFLQRKGLVTENPNAPKGIVPWLASQTDMLYEDWYEVDESCKLPASNETTQNEASGSYPHIENRFQQVK